MLPIKDNNGLFRDERTNAVVNCNDNEYNEYIKIKEQKLSEKSELDKLKSDIDEIKDAIKIILNKINSWKVSHWDGSKGN